MIDAFAAEGASSTSLSARVPSKSGDEVPLDRVWPSATAAYAGRSGTRVAEPICHGYLHLAGSALARGEIESREYADEGSGEAGGRST